MPTHPLISEEVRTAPQGTDLVVRLVALDYLMVALQGTFMTHLQTPLTGCELAPLAAIFVGFRRGIVVGGAHGLFVGWATGALLAEPTGIPALATLVVGALAGSMRESFHLDRRAVRLWMAFSLVVVAELLQTALTLVVWQRMPAVLPLSLAVHAALCPVVDVIVAWCLPER